MDTGRYTYLDLLRGLAAFSVIIVHYRWFYASHPGDWGASFTQPLPLAWLLQPIYDHGGFAVQLFWLLSGIVFTIKYATGRRFDGRRFWIWRLARLYPLHFTTLLAITLIQLVSIYVTGTTQIYAHFDLYHFALQLLMASSWGLERGDSFNGPIWSASVEILIYAVFFLYARYGKPGLIRQILAMLAFSILWWITRSPLASCGSLFFLGGIIPLARALLPWRLRRLIAFTLFPLLYAGLMTARMYGVYVPDLVYFYVIFPPLLLFVLEADVTFPPVPDALRWIGDVTYATYLLHMPILISAKLWIDTRPDRLDLLASPLALIAYFGTVVIVSVLVYRGYERPMQLWIQHRYDRRVPTNAIDREIARTI